MKRLSIRDTRLVLPQIETLLQQEGELVITRHGRPVARIVPLESGSLPAHAELRRRMPRVRPTASELILQEREDRA